MQHVDPARLRSQLAQAGMQAEDIDAVQRGNNRNEHTVLRKHFRGTRRA